MRQVAIIVLNWNGLEDTERCLKSLAELEKPAETEIRVWVVDNGSEDGSPELLPSRFPWARYLNNSENLRYAGGNNVGIRAALEAGADFILLLNNDTEVDPGLVADLLGDADLQPEAGIFGPVILNSEGSVWYAGGGVSTWWGWTWHEGMRSPVPPRDQPSRETGYVTGCCLLSRRQVYEKIGLLDEGYFLYAEDVDLCLRAKSQGFANRLVPRARVTHYVSSSSGGTVNPFKAYHRTRAGIRLFVRWSRGLQKLTWPFGYLLATKVYSLSWLLHGSPASVWAAFRAIWDAMLGKPPGDAYPPKESKPVRMLQ